MKRLVIAIDSKGIYFRETLCVIHHGESGEVEYQTKPIDFLGALKIVWELLSFAKSYE